MTRDFDLSDILTITTGRLVSSRRMEGVYDLLNFMTRDDLMTHQLPRASEECRPWLIRQHPALDSPEVDFQVAKLILMLETPSGKADPTLLVAGWMVGMKAMLGDTLAIKPIPADDHRRIDPASEAVAMMGGDESRVIVITVSDPEVQEAR